MENLKLLSRILALPLVGLIAVYQKTLSPDHGFVSVLFPRGYCPRYPSCSEYARLNLLNRGLAALPRIAVRVIGCRPGTECRVDLP